MDLPVIKILESFILATAPPPFLSPPDMLSAVPGVYSDWHLLVPHQIVCTSVLGLAEKRPVPTIRRGGGLGEMLGRTKAVKLNSNTLIRNTHQRP